MLQKSALHLCIDRVIPYQQKIKAADIAVKENPLNLPKPLKLLPGASLHPAKMALVTGKRWDNRRALGVHFMDGSTTQKAKVRQFANLSFDYDAGRMRRYGCRFRLTKGHSRLSALTACTVTTSS